MIADSMYKIQNGYIQDTSLARPSYTVTFSSWEANVKMYLTEMGCELVDLNKRPE